MFDLCQRTKLAIFQLWLEELFFNNFFFMFQKKKKKKKEEESFQSVCNQILPCEQP